MLRQVSPIGKENNTNTRLKNHQETCDQEQVTHIHQISSTLIQKRQNKTRSKQPEKNNTKDLIGLSSPSTPQGQRKDSTGQQIQKDWTNTEQIKIIRYILVSSVSSI